VFFPGSDVGANLDQFAGPLFFKLGTDLGKFTALRDNDREHSLAAAPTHAGEVIHAGARLEIDCVDLVLLHQVLSFRNAGFAFIERDGHDAVRHLLELAKSLRSFALLKRFRVAALAMNQFVAE
jgi:hypothetical protein